MATRSRLALRSIVALTATIVMVAAWAPVVSAEVVVPGPAAGTQANPPTSTVEIINTGAGQGVNGFMSPRTPAERLAGYPEAPDPSWPSNNVGFAGLIQMRVTSGPGMGTTFVSYCIDLLTPTGIGSDYKRGEWTEAGIPNVGYVAQLLQSYYPTTTEPSSQTNVNARAAAVQSAIWYFSDGYVLATDSPLFATVSGIVANVIAKGPLNAPPAPTLTVTGPSNGLKNTIVGPFVVDTNGKEAIGTVPAGVTAFEDAAGSVPLDAPFAVVDGDEIWLRSTEAGIKNPALTIRAIATQPGGVVFVYVPPQSNPNARAQTIIQAGPLTAETDVNTRVAFLDIGSFTVTKSITGDGAGQQGPITITIVCSEPNSNVPPFAIPGGAPGGTVTTVVTGITVPARCLLTETASGATQEVDVFADAPAGELAARRRALFATQEVSVCPASSFSGGAQPLAASAGAEFQASPGANFQNVVEATTTTATTTPITSTPTIPTTVSTTTTATTTPTTPTTVSTTTATTTATTGATTTAATTTLAPTTVVPTTAVDECEFAGDTTTPTAAPTTAPETLPATGPSGSGPLVVGLLGLVGGLGLVAIASRRRGFTD